MSAPTRTVESRIALQLQQREDELRALLQADEAASLHADEGGAEVTDFKDVASSEALAAVEDVQAAHAAAELQQVLAARRRLDEGSYGVCVGCGEPIEEGRLLAMPAAALCVACQGLQERGH